MPTTLLLVPQDFQTFLRPWSRYAGGNMPQENSHKIYPTSNERQEFSIKLRKSTFFNLQNCVVVRRYIELGLKERFRDSVAPISYHNSIERN